MDKIMDINEIERKLDEASIRRAKLVTNGNELVFPEVPLARFSELQPPPMIERFIGCILCGAAGDAIGFHGGAWEFCKSGETIHRELMRIASGNLAKLSVIGFEWRISDDTIMHLATAEGLTFNQLEGDELYKKIAECYVKWWPELIKSRSPGMATVEGIRVLGKDGTGWNKKPFSANEAGCGSAMRSMCIGLRFNKPEMVRQLIACSIQTSMITHHCGTGYLGAVTAAYFTSLAIQRINPRDWGVKLLKEIIPLVNEHIKLSGRFVQKNLASQSYFINRWKEYLRIRHLITEAEEVDLQGPLFPSEWNENIRMRDEFYTYLSFSGCGGASGHDSVMIAYDSLLFAGPSWEKLIKCGALHSGDSDSTGHIAASFWGSVFGFHSVPPCNIKTIEFSDQIFKLATTLHQLYA